MERVTLKSTIIAILILAAIIIFASDEDCDSCFSPPTMAIKFIVAGLAIIVSSVFYTGRFLRMENIIFKVERQPLLTTDQAVDGVPFEGTGTVENTGDLLTSPYSQTQCVYYHSIKEQYVSGGDNSRWEVRDNLVSYVPFYIRDKRGMLTVDMKNMDKDFSNYEIEPTHKGVPNPEDSEVDCDHVLRHSQYSEEKKLFGPLKSTTQFMKNEFVLKPGTNVLVYGMVSKRDGKLVLHEDPDHPLIISKKSRNDYIEEFFKGGSLVYFMHVLAAFGFTLALFGANYFFRIAFSDLLTPLIVGNAVILGSVFFSVYNRIITLDQRATNAISNIDIELKRRFDLIGNIVKIVKEYAKYEKEVNAILVEARSQVIYSDQKPGVKSPELKSLIAVVERYPRLKAAENFQALMQELIDTEERIAYSREFYNRTVLKFNILIAQVPFIIVAAPLSMKNKQYLTIGRQETAVPTVSLS